MLAHEIMHLDYIDIDTTIATAQTTTLSRMSSKTTIGLTISEQIKAFHYLRAKNNARTVKFQIDTISILL